MVEKTVYVLGAGASRTANLPIQNGLLPLIFSININDMCPFNGDFLSLAINEKAERIRELYPIFDQYRQNLGDFIVDNFSSSDKINQYHVAIDYANSLESIQIGQKAEYLFKAYKIVRSVGVSLEDLFTIFDNVAVGRNHFRLYSPDKMSRIHNELKLTIIYSLVYSLATQCDNTQYKRFSELLLKTRLGATQNEDIVSVITMNWDDVLEQTLFELCDLHNQSLRKNQKKIYPDLCFYNYTLNKSSNYLPSIHIKAKGHRNIKILKMHGSLSWLECPKCGRIYTDFLRDIAVDEYSGINCPYCAETDSVSKNDPVLRNLIITPTFMKSFDNLNLKNIWHNAYIDVSEADHLIFIGYSFPDADFEMRCLLKKSTKSNAKITVVLHSSDDPSAYMMNFLEKGYSEAEAMDLVSKMSLPEERYKTFFGEGSIVFCYNGLQGFLDDMEVENG